MRPYVEDPKIYLTVQFQHTNGGSSWEIKIVNIMSLIEPAFEKFQLVSFTIYKPAVAGQPQVFAVFCGNGSHPRSQ